MCLHYLVKPIARVLSPYITYFSILRACAAAEGGQFEHELWLVVQQCCCNCAFWLCRLIVWLLIKFAVTVFSVLSLFQSHAAVVNRYNAFCVKLTANSDIEQNNISKIQHLLYVLVNIFTFNELWDVTFCYKTRRICNVWRQNSCNEFCKVV